MRIFGVDYQFLSCGSVFTDGLVHAAADLGVAYAHARWDEPNILHQIAEFNPDLLFVVHGRHFAQRFRDLTVFGCETAVWLLDEPYEVDDTSSWSSKFDRVFVCDPSTLGHHARATYLPACYDPHVHRPGQLPRIRNVGFVGGGNSTRERYLSALARAGVLDYVVGGDWSDDAIGAICLSRNIRPAATAELYGTTKIILNVFRETHHFNRHGVAATAMNPRVYEATACGALVVSEPRYEMELVVPELPTFRTEAECVAIVHDLLAAPDAAEAVRAVCAERLAPHTYAARLKTVLSTVRAEVAA